MKYIAFLFIFLYSYIIKPILVVFRLQTMNTCKFYPSCSEYSKECFKKYCFFKAFKKTIKRIQSCNPKSLGGVDLP